MTDTIRKKHEEHKENNRYNPFLQRIGLENALSTLTISEVDALFRELDAHIEVGESLMKEVKRLDKELDKSMDALTASHMHGFETGKDQYRDKVRKLEIALDEARGRVEKAIEQCDTEYGYVPVVGFKLIRRILKGGGDG